MRSLPIAWFLFVSSVLVVPALAGPPKDQVTLRDRAQALCYDDANKLCPDAIPDEDRVKSCMVKKRSQLSAQCREIFDQGMK